ncbi:MAG: ribose 5-phosphate isomerase B [Candidatus Berkelbacteria bacterium Licking1014_7]|uniref:Ribose 5-phosphate isomerase B n=1 Tax=Candidatus Berkelbacteria bacterium Licking1014_7 TaxID=2017147 RepID=A0A554LJ52_9BACT|nr:MAG: ribose 5-phosphate isomerase B [Candidatus Berkelbacteria bacterium Licking1014_7]
MKIFIGSDHRGYKLKSKIKNQKSKVNFEDLGVFSEENADYPIIAEKVANEVIKNPDSLGILICGSGQGMCIAANKIKGVRAAIAWNEATARAGREDDHINILCLSADYVDETKNLKIIKTFLSATPKNEKRYLRRLSQIQKIENNS